MADEFKSFDQTPILSRLNLRRLNCGIRDLILIGVIAVLLVMVLVFAGLYGKAVSKSANDASPNIEANARATYCTDANCLKTAARVLGLMNRSVNPCENFYEYACGNYSVVKRLILEAGERSVLDDMDRENEDRLSDILESPISQMHDYATERKLKQFFQSCNDMDTREKLRGTPFLTKVLPVLGGWKLLGTWDANWDLNTALRTVHTDFWVNALLTAEVQTDPFDHTQRVIEIWPGGTGKYMTWGWYLDPNTEQIRQDYKKFMRRVASLLLRDSEGGSLKNATLQEEYLDEFVNDTFTIEQRLASIANQSENSDDAADDINKVTLADLQAETGSLINWVEDLSSVFTQAAITSSTKIIVQQREYFQKMTASLASVPGSDRNRMLHNYLIWRVAEMYSQDLSWEYFHANRDLFFDLHNRHEYLGMYRYCFSMIEYYFSDGLGSLYVNEHFADESKQMVSDITDNIKLALQTQLDQTPWLDQKIKQYAKDKLNHVNFKMGYPDWMANRTAVDDVYNVLSVNVSDYFGNVLSTNRFEQANWNDRLVNGENREEWRFPVFYTQVGVYWYWNEIIAPAGILQPPIYHRRQPHHTTFGSLGAILGRFLHHIVDEWGKSYDKNGNYMAPETWWSNSSLEAYKTIRECVHNVYTNVSKDYVFPNGVTQSFRINANYYTPIAISWTNGIRLAHIGYADWLKSQGILEKMLPGFGLTNEQMIYVAHAQTFCNARDAKSAYLFASRGRVVKYPRMEMADDNNIYLLAISGEVEEDIQVNMALGQMQEFSDAFHCKPGSKMNHPKKCDYY